MTENELSGMTINICLAIHRKYGPGLLESAYEEIFCYEWGKTGIPFTQQQAIPLIHEGLKLQVAFRADVILANKLLIEFKSLEIITPVHFTRLKTYLVLTDIKLGLMLNFGAKLFKEGIYRMVNRLDEF